MFLVGIPPHLSLIIIVSSWTRMQCIFADGSPFRRLRLGGRWSLASCYTQSQWYKLRPKCEVYGSQHNADSHGNVQALMKHNNFLCLHHFVFSQWTKYFQEPSSITWQQRKTRRGLGRYKLQDNPTAHWIVITMQNFTAAPWHQPVECCLTIS